MKLERSGIILCTRLYNECVTFYSQILELPIMDVLDDEHSKLTVLAFGADTYLMIETGGYFSSTSKKTDQNPVWLRFNVTSVENTAQILSTKGVNVTIRHEPWGTVGDFTDPDGNPCSLKQERIGHSY